MRVRKIAARLGYEVNRIQGTPSKLGHFLVVTDAGKETLSASLQTVLSGVQACTDAHNIGLMLMGKSSAKQARAISDAIKTASGALFIMPRGSSPLIEQCRFHGLPIAVAARSREQLLPQHVDIAVHADEARVAALIVDHLLEHGHRSIAFAAVDDGNRMMETRADELKKALTKRGLPVHPEWFFMRALKMADQLIAACRREDGPTAIVCGSDFVALQIVHVLREAELAIPGDVSVVGVHNHDFVNFLSPPITTVDIGLEEIGYQAALQLLDYAMRPNNRPSIDITLEPRLVVRSSVAPV